MATTSCHLCTKVSTMYAKLERLSGNPHLHHTKGSPFEHCCHSTATMGAGMKRAADEVADALLTKRRS